ncbi:MAG: hypothetical protein ABI743_10260, partial [bacterium]
MSNQPKPAFYIALGLVILVLVGIGFSRMGKGTSKPGAPSGGDVINPEDLNQAEAPDEGGITTAKEYSFVPATKLPEVKGVSNYKDLKDNTVRMAINVWAGWGPIILANNGMKAGKEWSAP